MPELDRSRLLNFLSKPRYVRDVAEHFGVSSKLANYHLRKAVRSGDVLAGEGPLPQMLPNSDSRRRPSKEFVYVSRKSPFLAGNKLRLTAQNVGKDSRSNINVTPMKFLLKTQSLAEEKLLRHKGWDLVSRFLNRFVYKARLARHGAWNQRLVRGRLSDRGEQKSFSHIEKLRLFQALSDQPLPFLDIRTHFGVSKRTIMGLVRRGFLEEEWGPRDIGVRFRLTKKGRSYLRQLEAAAHVELQQREKIFIRLKHRVFS